MTENLRTPAGIGGREPLTLFDYSTQEGFFRSIELCNGSGVCRKLQGGAMCPSFRATMDEKDSTRGRANALRLALSGAPDPGGEVVRWRGGERETPLRHLTSAPPSGLRERWVHDVLDLCLMCKACKAECPSNVDMAKLKAEFLQAYYEDRTRPLGHWLVAHIHLLNRRSAWAAPLVNLMQILPPMRWLLEMIAGIDRRRSLPTLRSRHFRRWHGRRRTRNDKQGARRVLLLDDCFTTFNEPKVGKAAVRVLEAAGCAVELAGLPCCGRPLISKGFLKEARALVQAQAPALAKRLSDGTPLLGLEPSCLLTLVDEWPELSAGAETRHIAAAAELAESWLVKQVSAGACGLSLRPRPEKSVLHGHCHQKALVGVDGTAAALRLIPGLDVTVLDAGCCGMAGSFGFEKEHYELSVKIANLALLPALAAEPDAMVIAPGTSCRHQIHDLAHRRAMHPLEVLAEQLRT